MPRTSPDLHTKWTGPVDFPDMPWVMTAYKELGQMEVPGPGNNPRITMYHSATTIGASDDDVSWCSSFINWVMQQNGIAGTRSPAARSWTSWGQDCTAKVGSIAVLWREDPSSWKGHVGIVAEVDFVSRQIWIISGNVGNAVTVDAFPMSRVLAYRCPKLRRNSTTIRAVAGAGGAGAGLTGLTTASVVASQASETATRVSETASKVDSTLGSMGIAGLAVLFVSVGVFCLWWIYRERVKKLKQYGV